MLSTGDWISLRNNSVYRKFDIYSALKLNDVDLEYMTVCGAQFAGPIAITKDYKQLIPMEGRTKPFIMIINGNGALISTIRWKHGNMLTMGWSDSEELLCVQDDGLVVIYDMFGEEKHTFSMGQEATYTKVIDARIFATSSGTGVAVMTTNFRVFVVNNYKEPKMRQLPDIPKSVINPTCWEVLTEDKNTYCLIGSEKEIIRLSQGQNACTIHTSLIEKNFKSFIKISVSYNHRYLSLYTDNGIIWLGTTDMKTKFCEYDTNRIEMPRQIEWILDSENCRQSDAVIIAYPSLLLIINTSGDQNMYTYDSRVFLIPEMDGVRVFTNTSHEMIQKVPKCVQNIFAINSQEPASFLFEAYKKFQEKSHQSDEYLGLIKDKMDVAVNECIEAAGYEFDSETQKSLILTAYFGKGFISSHNPDQYIKMCRILRVLNALRHPNVGLPLTYQQFCFLQANVILDRLVFRKYYATATQMAKHLKLPESRILEHWAFHKIIYDKDDQEVTAKITKKFKSLHAQEISFCNIAEKAYSVGRDQLAINLLELEPKAALQVPLLLKLGKDEKALASATKSGDTDLISMVLLQLKETTPLAKFQMIIRQFPVAHNLYKKYCKLYSKTTLQDLFAVESDYQSQAELTLREGLEKGDIESILPTTELDFSKAHRNCEAELCSETRKLIKQQKLFAEKFGKTFNKEFYGLSVNETLKALLSIGDLKLAEKFKNEYKIPERRYWWIRIQIIAKSYNWDELEKFSKTKKSPIGYEPFVEVCIKQGNVIEARKYLPKVKDDKKCKWYIRAGLLDDAANIAFEQKDINNLQFIQVIATKAKNKQIVQKVDSLITLLNTKK